jgi:hypothetical protein
VCLRSYEFERTTAIRNSEAGSVFAAFGPEWSTDTISVSIMIISSEFHDGGAMSGDALRGAIPLHPFKVKATTYAATPQ